MKPFKINRNSWHYRLNRHFFNQHSYSMDRNWEPNHSNFCSYWRATMFRLIFAIMLTIVAGLFLSMIVVGAYYNPWKALEIVLTIFIACLTLFGAMIVAYCIHEYKERNKKTVDEPKSLFVQKYRAYKSKVCPMVEYD